MLLPAGHFTAVSGGRDNVATGYASSVQGGRENTGKGHYTIVGGGNLNFAAGHYSNVQAGFANQAFGYGSTIVGGHNNTAGYEYDDQAKNITAATGAYAFIGAGWSNIANGASLVAPVPVPMISIALCAQ